MRAGPKTLIPSCEADPAGARAHQRAGRRWRFAAGTLRLLLLALLFAASPAHAVQPDEQLADPVLEARARDISGGLRCLVCQNQSIDDSDAPLARDLRLLVRERLKAGDSDEAVRRYLVARYGEFILLKPPFEVGTLLLWLTPLVALVIGGVVVLVRMRRPAEKEGLTGEEEEALARILRQDEAKLTDI